MSVKKKKNKESVGKCGKNGDQAKLANLSCGLNPGTERDGNTSGFIVTRVHLKIDEMRKH